MAQELIIVRGLPGSGKSTFANTLCFLNNSYKDAGENAGADMEDACEWKHFETDQFFVKDGQYLFDPQKVGQAHVWCQVQVGKALAQGHSVIVSNTFTRNWEMRPYLDMAAMDDIRVTVLTVEGNHGNIHNVPKEKIQEMKNRWEKYNG